MTLVQRKPVLPTTSDPVPAPQAETSQYRYAVGRPTLYPSRQPLSSPAQPSHPDTGAAGESAPSSCCLRVDDRAVVSSRCSLSAGGWWSRTVERVSE